MRKLFYFLITGFVFFCVSCADKMVVIPEGFFVLGGQKEDFDAVPQQNVFLSEYKIDVYEVSVKKYQKCIKAGSCNFPLEGQKFTWNKKKKNFPINGVSWFDANNYCHFVKKRLPTEVEWEKAASWLNDTKYIYSVPEFRQSCLEANYNALQVGCREEVAARGSYRKELNGTYDMAGNLWEWVWDWYSPVQYQQIIPRDPEGPSSGLLKVNKGGSYANRHRYIQTTYRGANNPVLRTPEIGFRCAVGVDQTKK